MQETRSEKWYQHLPIPSTATPLEAALTVSSDLLVGTGLAMSFDYIRHGEIPFAIMSGVIGIQSITGSIFFRMLAFERFCNQKI